MPKVNLISLLAPRSGHATTIKVFWRLIEDFLNEFLQGVFGEKTVTQNVVFKEVL